MGVLEQSGFSDTCQGGLLSYNTNNMVYYDNQVI